MDPRRHLLRNAWITLLASLAFAAVLALPGRAGANTFAYGTIGPITGATLLGIGSGAHSAGSFTDIWTFTVAPTDNFFLGAEVLAGNASSGVTFSSVNLTGYPGAPVLFANTTNFFVPLSSTLLAPGAYTMTVIGNAATTGGFYNAAVNFAPIPEPETYAMMLAGLGLMGFVARRRKPGRVLA